MRKVPMVSCPGRAEFVLSHQSQRIPLVLKGCSLGVAVGRWTPEYLAECVGESPVQVHVCGQDQMDFIDKNFFYRKLPFNEFIRRASSERQTEHFISPAEKYYLRSLGSQNSRKPAVFHSDYPSLADDLVLPDLFMEENLFSSVLRVSSAGLKLWTHYDIMDNIMIQINGRKRVVLFRPDSFRNMYVVGDKSRVLDIDHPDLDRFPKFSRVQRWECFLDPGDVLFIPALWFHHVTALDFSITVNVFWKNALPTTLYDPRDIYGNNDLLPAQKALTLLHQAIELVNSLPSEYREFYLQRMADIIDAHTSSSF